MERIRTLLKGFRRDGRAEITEKASPSTSSILSVDLERRVAPSSRVRPFLDEQELAEENRRLTHALKVTGDVYDIPFKDLSKDDYRRWVSLVEVFEDVSAIQLRQREELARVDQLGAESWFRVALAHTLDVGCSLVVRRNVQQQLNLSRKYGLEGTKGPYLGLSDFYRGAIAHIKIGDITLQDFLAPKAKSPVGYYRFLAQACLAVHRNLYDVILADNLDSPQGDYPNVIKGVIWTLPNTMNSLFTISSDIMEQVYKKEKHPLNEVGLAAAQLIKGIGDIRERTYKLLLNPRSEYFQDLRQTLQEYFSTGDNQTIILVLNLLGLNKIANINETYRQSRRYVNEGTEEEFFSQLGVLVKDYAREVSLVYHISDEDDMDLIADLDNHAESDLQTPSFDQLGQVVSDIFQKSSKADYAIQPESIEWLISSPQSVMIRFDKNRPRIFDVALSYTNDKDESMDVIYGLDTTKGSIRWDYLADPMLPETRKIAIFRSLLLVATQSILGDVQKQAAEEYRTRMVEKGTSAVQTQKAKRERFDDPIYALRKEMKDAQRQSLREESASERIVSAAELTQAAVVKNEVVIPGNDELQKLLRAVSIEDRQKIMRVLGEFNQYGTGGSLDRKDKLGPDGRERWSLRISCSVPKGVRVLMAPLEFSKGLRRFEIVDIRYRKDIYPRNKI